MAKKKLTDAILFALEKSLDGYLALDYFYKHGTAVFYGYDLPKSSLRASVSRLGKKGYIEKQHNEDKIILKLTEAGSDWILKHRVDDGLNWDGVWRLVIFDIPESHKRVRNILRRRLKDWGFSQWQKSVWATKKPLTEALRDLVKELEVEEWVLVIESIDIGK